MIEKQLQNILQLGKSHQSKLYIVGGTLRDLILGRQCSDFDFAVRSASTLAKEYAHDTKSALVPLDTTPGRETFRVVTKKNIHFDFSELQGESIETDLSQRDFTINAMAISLQNFIGGSKDFIDPCNGKYDIEKKIIRVLPGPIFLSDPLRMLRAFRFMSKIQFKIENATFNKIKKLGAKINHVATERILSELKILLSSTEASPSIEAMHNSGMLKHIFPDLYKSNKTPRSLKPFNHLEFLASNPKQINLKPLTEIKKALSNRSETIKLGSILYPLIKTSKVNKRTVQKTKIGKILSALHASKADINYIDAITSCANSASNKNLYLPKNKSNQIELYKFVDKHELGLISGLFLSISNLFKFPITNGIGKDLA
ncbi:MAG TPA: CCA tRNA nucleotidyltransferase [Nitrospinaceae bacterium]|nr:CCA tRNA nucleotidyltransferase [Nitrospinaceae bacterium]